MIDMSVSMHATYLTSGDKKLKVAIEAAKTAINSLSPNDNVSQRHKNSLPNHVVLLCPSCHVSFPSSLRDGWLGVWMGISITLLCDVILSVHALM